MPLLGVNLGKVGFLSKVEANELESVLAQVVAGEYSIDERMAARGADPARRRPKASGERFVALNDVVVARGSLARVVRLDVAIGPSHLATFIADGLVVVDARPARPATRSPPAARSSIRSAGT